MATLSAKATAAVAAQRASAVTPASTSEKTQGTSLLDPVQQLVQEFEQGSRGNVVEIRLDREKGRPLVEKIINGHGASVDDLYLRRQALQFSLHPGFDTLLSLTAVRDMTPFDYQIRTVRHVLANLRGRALLCDEVGMGKTVEAGLIALEYMLRGLARRVLILAPPSLVSQWREEMQVKFNLDFITYDDPAFKAHHEPWTFFPRIIASIDTAKRESHRLQIGAAAFDLVICDEAHHLKNRRTQAYQLVSQLQKKYILLLTATPVENDLEELFNLITLLLPGQLETAAAFKKKYITRGDALKPKNTEELKALVREVMVRNRRSETGVILSRRYAETIRLQLSPEEMAFYRRLTHFVRGFFIDGQDKPQGGASLLTLKVLQREIGSSIEAVLPTLTKMAEQPSYAPEMRRLFAALLEQAKKVPHRAKADALVQLLRGLNDKVIVFTGFSETHRYLVRRLTEAGFAVAQLHGGMKRLEKEEQVRYFADVAQVLLSTETGSEGRNLQFCRCLVNYDLPWNPMQIEQRIGRIHRIGQERDVYIYNLSAQDTLEAHMLELLDAKINMFQLVVGELDMILGNLKENQGFEDMVLNAWLQSADEREMEAQMDKVGDQLLEAKNHYLAVKAIDERLLGELVPDE
ncbi:DEAD/DEAH box helicase [Heliomicrobium modesticaldum]|uniref:DEAD/DEAH box helicase n=1 Tax=Heliomicrobium modesticaldum TaxID=35701 RepID=UPI000A02890E|nr:SNF2-related protein [Heliomicrobium modesticaldum]